MEPTTSGSYVGEHRNGYFWNGTSWEAGPTTAAAPSTAFGGTVINQQNAKSTPAASSAAKRASILSTIMRIESGGRNIPQNIDDINMRRGTPAQGYFQIISPTWSQFGGDKTGHKSAIDAPYPVQLEVAQNIPVSHWGPATQEALRAAGYEPQSGETLGQMLARYKEDPNATRPEDVGGSSDGGRTAVADKGSAPDLSGVYAGLLAQQQQQQAATARAAALAEEAKQQAGMQSVMKQGTGLLAAGETPAPQMSLQPLPIHRPQMQQQAGGPDFTQMLAQQRLMRRV